MHEITSIEIRLLISQLSGRIEGSRLRKFYDLGNGSFRLTFYKDGQSTMLYCKLLQTFNITEYADEAREATSFAMGVRKRIENSVISGIEQAGSDRIIMLNTEHGHRLVIEMFGKGNMILLNREGKIELCHRSVKYRDRSIAPSAAYSLPQSSSIPFDLMTKEKLGKILEGGSGKVRIITFLSRYMNIGPLYLEDAIKRSGLDPKEALEGNSKEKLIDNLLSLLARIADCRPRIYLSKGRIVDYAISPIQKYEGLEVVEYDSMSALLDDLSIKSRSEGVDTGKLERIKETDANIEHQKRLAEEMKAEAEAYEKSANKIFENMHLVNSLIDYLQRRKRATPEELRGAFKDVKINGIDLRNKTVKIDV